MALHPKITDTYQASRTSGVKVVVYGPAGIGKTRLCATVPQPLILSAERGTLSLRKERLPTWPIESMADFQEAYNWVVGAREARQFHTICLDSASDLAEVVLSHEKKMNTNKSNGFKPYNELNEQFMNLMRSFRALNERHVFFIAKEEKEKDANTGAMLYGPSMPGKTLTNQIPYLVDEIFRMVPYTDEHGQPQAALQCHMNNIAVAKDRSGALSLWEPPHLGAIFDKIMAVS